MSIISSDPLAFLLAQGGIVGTPLQEAGASGAENLDVQQRGAVIGEPIPIVFCRRVSGVGGVLISPSATEARFEDNVSGDVTASYHLVLSEGQIDSIQVRDVFQRSCRVGSFSQTYGKRAGTFIPGNFIDDSDVEAPYYCGTGGRYTGLSTLAFTVTIPAGFDQWNRQVHCFVRGGMHITRLLDNVTGPSNNVADLLLYLLRNSSKVPEVQIDTASLLAAATFTNANGFWFNGSVSESTNLRDWIGDTLPYFLLRQTRIGGKEALRPLLPTNNDGTLKTTPVSWAFTFTEQHIIPDSFEIIYTPLADRKPFCVTVLWRQQDDLGLPVMRTAEVRYAGTAIDGPFEQHDLTGFCASENHAVKVGAFILSKRRHVTHRLQIAVRPDGFNPTLASGNLVRVRLERTASTGVNSRHDFLYEVDRIGKSITGEVQLELTHFPIDQDLASVVAKEVNAATGAGLVLPTGLTGITCDINSLGDVTIPDDNSLSLDYWQDYWADNGYPNLFDDATYNTDLAEIDPIDTSGLGGTDSSLPERWWTSSSDPTEDNPKDELDNQEAEAAPFVDLSLSLSEPTVSSICLNSLYEVTFEATVVRAPSVSDYAVVFSLNNAEVFEIPADESGPVEVKFVHNLLNDALPQTYSIDIEGVSDGEGGENISLGTQDFTVELDLDEPVAIKAIVVDEEPALCSSGITVPTSIPFFGTVSPPILAATGGPFDDQIMTFPPVTGGVKRILSLLDNQLVLGTNPFTIEFWFNKVAAINIFSQPIVDFGDTPDFADTIANIAVGAAGGVGSPETMFISIFDSNFNSGDWELGPITPDTWYHIAIVRDTTEIRAYLGGVEIPPDYVSGPIHEADFNIGGFDFNATNSTNGRDYRINQFAITKGVAKYSDNFTPPSERV
jgi:hypothetical protein